MSRYKDISNKKFGKLIALIPRKFEGRNPIYWDCVCECGNTALIAGVTLRSGKATSCGCNVNQSAILRFKKQNPNASPQEILKERIKAKTKWVGDCLEWTATISNGYGTFVYNKKCINASRAAWIAEHGEIAKGLCVLHKCDNRKCCNTKHLFLGTHKQNTADMIKKGRDNWETTRKFPIGTREKAWELRQQGKSWKEIAEELNLKISQIGSLLQNYKNKLKRQPD